MKNVISILLCLIMGITCANSAYGRTHTNTDTHTTAVSRQTPEEEKSIERSARSIIHELSDGKPEGNATFRYPVTSRLKALTFVHQMILNHTAPENFPLTGDGDYRLYESSMLKVWYTEDGKKAKDGIAEAVITFKDTGETYTIIFPQQ